MSTHRTTTTRLHRRGWLSRTRSDDGVGTIELIGLTPLIVLLTFGTVQLGLWMHGRQLVTAAAQEAAVAAAAADLTTTEATSLGERAADRFVADQQVVQVQSVTVTRGPATVDATVTGTGLSMIPGVQLRVTGVASSGVERFVGAP